MIWKFCCGISMSKIIFTTNSIYLLNYTSKKLGNSLAVVFHHPLPVSKYFVKSILTNKFTYIVSVISFEITPDRFGISFLKGSQHLHIYYQLYIRSAAVPASTYQMKTYLKFIFLLSQYVKDRFDSLKLSVSIIEMIMSKNSFKSFGIYISI